METVDKVTAHSVLDKILAKLEQETDSEAAAALVGDILSTMGKFHKYSWSNQMLIAAQRPGATIVAGLKLWNKVGRQVKRGEKGIRIFAPRPFTTTTINQAGEEEAHKGMSFVTVCVFDVAQTDGEALKDPLSRIPGDWAPTVEKLTAFALTKGITVETQALSLGHYGTSYGGKIVVKEGLESGQHVLVLVHEITHELLHQGQIQVKRDSISSQDMELEAEATAYAVGSYFGMVNPNSAAYLRLYKIEGKQIRAHFAAISKATSEILGALTTGPV